MKSASVSDQDTLQSYLENESFALSRAIAYRAALRAVPAVHSIERNWLGNEIITLFRALLLISIKVDDYYLDISRSVDAALINIAIAGFTPIQAMNGPARISTRAALKSVVLNHNNVHNYAMDAVAQAALFVEDRAWLEANQDCFSYQELSELLTIEEVASRMGGLALWSNQPPVKFTGNWHIVREDLHLIDSNFTTWTNWFERRVMGQDTAFVIPGDEGRMEDKKILRRLAEATDDDFWGKGHEYVNATLKGWLDEARENVRPKEVHALQAMDISTGPPEIGRATLEHVVPLPRQDIGAIAYGVNEQGKLDRLPSSDQAHLRDVPDQRRAYDDLREAAAELLDEGQRLGHRLKRALDRFLHSLPDGIEDAEAYLVWRDANALRRLHRAHREASKSPEPDEARLEPVIAEGLGGLLDLYNNFAFADDGLRAKDEARIAPQERASAEAEARAAIPLVQAMLANPEIATPEALDDIVADRENAELSAQDAYADQVLDQSNRTKRNIVAGLISDTWAAFKSTGVIGQAIAGGAAWDGIKLTATIIGGTDYAPLMQFIATNPGLLQHYVAVAFPAFEHLSELIDRIRLYWLTRSKA